ncbi:hypothetical protein Vadar_018366 [Vaccinium darrowii]|nr:hypothetical protein Vadar_018366 [Vaccinium darrowii]
MNEELVDECQIAQYLVNFTIPVVPGFPDSQIFEVFELSQILDLNEVFVYAGAMDYDKSPPSSGLKVQSRDESSPPASQIFDLSLPLSLNHGKTFKKPRRPYEKERLDAELKLVGEYGLRCKRELWRVQYALSRIRNAARMLLTLDEKNPRRIFEGEALLRRMYRYGLLDENQNKLDYVLALTVENFLERRLQTLVFKTGMAKSIHHARVLIRQRHIRVGRQVVNIASFMVRLDSQKHIDFSLTSPLGGGRPGRVKRKNQKAAAKKAAGGDGDEEDEE